MRREEAGGNDPWMEEERLQEEEYELRMNKLHLGSRVSLHENTHHALAVCLEVGQVGARTIGCHTKVTALRPALGVTMAFDSLLLLQRSLPRFYTLSSVVTVACLKVHGATEIATFLFSPKDHPSSPPTYFLSVSFQLFSLSS